MRTTADAKTWATLTLVSLLLLAGVSGAPNQPQDLRPPTWSQGPSLDILPTPTPHERPAPVQRAIDLAHLRDDYLTILEYEQAEADRLAQALTERPEGPQETPSARTPLPVPPETLRALVATYFAPEDVELMLRVAWCESRYDSNAANRTSSARGLWQFLRGWYSGDWGLTGPFDPYDPEASTRAAAQLLYETRSGIRNWDASRHCWG